MRPFGEAAETLLHPAPHLLPVLGRGAQLARWVGRAGRHAGMSARVGAWPFSGCNLYHPGEGVTPFSRGQCVGLSNSAPRLPRTELGLTRPAYLPQALGSR